MLGFCLRKSGKVDEAYLMKSKLKDALRQYLALQKDGKPQAKKLLEKIDEYLKANPGA